MSEIINLRRVRKAKSHRTREEEADANRVKHGAPARLRKAAEAEQERASQALEHHKLEPDNPSPTPQPRKS